MLDASEGIAPAMKEQRLYEESRSEAAAEARGSPRLAEPVYGSGSASFEDGNVFSSLEDCEEVAGTEDSPSSPSIGRCAFCSSLHSSLQCWNV